MKRRTFLRHAAASGLFASVASQWPVARAQGNGLKVGAVLNLSGAGAVDEVLVRDGALLRTQLVNAAGGAAGAFALELVVEDGQSSAAAAAEAANRLANRGDISFVIGPLIGSQALAAQPIFAAANIPHIAFAGDTPFTSLHAQAPLSARFGFQVPLQTAPLLKYAVLERGHESFFILGQDTAFGRDVSAAVRAQLALLGQGSLAAEPEFYPFLNTDFATLMTKALGSGADAVIIGTGVPIEIIAAAREFALQAPEGVGFYSQHTASTLSPVTSGYQSISQVLPSDQLIFTWFYDGGQARDFERTPSAAVQELEAAVQAQLGRVASAMEGWGWGGVQLIEQSLQRLVASAGLEQALRLDIVGELPPRCMDFILAGEEPFVTPFGDAVFLPCGQFDQQEGVATFRDGRPYLLRDRGYAAELVAPLCPAA